VLRSRCPRRSGRRRRRRRGRPGLAGRADDDEAGVVGPADHRAAGEHRLAVGQAGRGDLLAALPDDGAADQVPGLGGAVGGPDGDGRTVPRSKASVSSPLLVRKVTWPWMPRSSHRSRASRPRQPRRTCRASRERPAPFSVAAALAHGWPAAGGVVVPGDATATIAAEAGEPAELSTVFRAPAWPAAGPVAARSVGAGWAGPPLSASATPPPMSTATTPRPATQRSALPRRGPPLCAESRFMSMF
jgi:hypothetical protein